MEIKYPPLPKRIQSIFIDTIFIVLLMFAAGWLFNKYSGDENNDDAWLRAVVFIIIWAL